MTLVSIGDQVREGTYRFHSRFRRAVNFLSVDGHDGAWPSKCDSRWVSLVDEAIGDGPQNIVIRDFDAEPIPSGSAPLLITANTVGFGPHRFSFTDNDTYCSTVLVADWDRSLFERNLAVLENELRAASPPKSLAFLLDESRIMNFRPGFERVFTDQIRRGVDRIMCGHVLDGVRTLKGCGLGLTPSGDDFIAGLLIGLNLLGQLHSRDHQKLADEIFRAAKGGNVFSNTFLDLARRGLLFGRMKNLVHALLHESEDAVRKSAAKVLAIGGSSGADLGTGFLLTVRGNLGVS
jgi:hypothetical protein